MNASKKEGGSKTSGLLYSIVMGEIEIGLTLHCPHRNHRESRRRAYHRDEREGENHRDVLPAVPLGVDAQDENNCDRWSVGDSVMRNGMKWALTLGDGQEDRRGNREDPYESSTSRRELIGVENGCRYCNAYAWIR